MPLLFRLTRFFSLLVVLMPFSLMYLFSDLTFLVIYYGIRYRRKVVRDNLVFAFPGKNQSEIKQIEKDFYRFFCDLNFEILKIPGLSSFHFSERVKFMNHELFDNYLADKQSVLAVTSHFNNWEWGGLALCGIAKSHKILGVYKPLNDLQFDTYFKELRGRYGMELIAMKSTYRTLLRNKNQLTITTLLSDQTPTEGETEFVTEFLGRPTPVFIGAEKIARKLGYPVIFLAMRRTKRGYYEVEAIPVENHPEDSKPFEITKKHVLMLEKEIRLTPANWLWSHRRWKHTGKSWPESVVVD